MPPAAHAGPPPNHKNGEDRATLPGPSHALPARAVAIAETTPSTVWPPVYWLAECHICRRARTADRDDMFRFLRERWPDCCGHTMTFRVVHGEPPRADPAD